MSLKSKISSAITLGFAVAAFAVIGSAQEAPKTQDDNGQKMERKHGRGGHKGMHGGKGRRGFGGMRGGFGLRGIELTDAQKAQIRQIHEGGAFER